MPVSRFITNRWEILQDERSEPDPFIPLSGIPPTEETREYRQRLSRLLHQEASIPTSRDLNTISECFRAGLITRADLDNMLLAALQPSPEFTREYMGEFREDRAREASLREEHARLEASLPSLPPREIMEEILEWREPTPPPSCWERLKALAGRTLKPDEI